MPHLMFATRFMDLWYAVPLILAVSLVYAGTRHEAMDLILRRALRVGTSITVVMTLIFAVLWLITWRL